MVTWISAEFASDVKRNEYSLISDFIATNYINRSTKTAVDP